MLNKKSLKKVIMTVLALTMILGTVVFAAEGVYTKKLTATFGSVKINFEGSDVTGQIESMYDSPAFSVDGRTYVPVRAIGDLVGVDVDFDKATHTVLLKDPKIAEHKRQLDDKDAEIVKLKAEIIKLEKGQKEEKNKETSVTDRKSLETSLMKEYGYYKNIDFLISLSEVNNKVNVAISIDFASAKTQDNWNRLSYNERKYMIEDIVNQVRMNLNYPDVTGYIYDMYKQINLYSFSQTANGTLSVSGGGTSGIYDGYGYTNLNSNIERDFANYNIKDARLLNSNYGQWNQTFKIEFASFYRTEWNKLTPDQKDSLLYSVARQIESDYGYNYNYNYNPNYNYNYIKIDIIIGGSTDGSYYNGTYTSY